MRLCGVPESSPAEKWKIPNAQCSMPRQVSRTARRAYLGTITNLRSSAKRNAAFRLQLVWCLAIGWCFAARDFRLPLGASDEHTLQRSVRSEQRRGRPKELLPEGLRRKKWPEASLLLSHRSNQTLDRMTRSAVSLLFHSGSRRRTPRHRSTHHSASIPWP
jgi:hypothetical protein